MPRMKISHCSCSAVTTDMTLDPNNAPMGANLTKWGATFRVWAPSAKSVTVRGSFNGWSDQVMTQSANGYWSAFVPGIKEGDQYKFFVSGQGTTGYKRDPFARSLTFNPPFP